MALKLRANGLFRPEFTEICLKIENLEMEVEILNHSLEDADGLRIALNAANDYLHRRNAALEELLDMHGIDYSNIDDILGNVTN